MPFDKLRAGDGIMLDRSLPAKEKVDFACNDSSVPQPPGLLQPRSKLKKDGQSHALLSINDVSLGRAEA
jgi:hypothetical protein